MFVAVAASCLLFVFRTPHAFLHGKGLWTAITVILVLEPTFGGTNKKVKLRMLGTLVGGGLGGAIVAAAQVLNGGWAPPEHGDAAAKSLAVALMISAACWVLQFCKLRDPNRECALACCPAVALPMLTRLALRRGRRVLRGDDHHGARSTRAPQQQRIALRAAS
jgi:hypothetical protein